jgi:hypothetical protein
MKPTKKKAMAHVAEELSKNDCGWIVSYSFISNLEVASSNHLSMLDILEETT